MNIATIIGLLGAFSMTIVAIYTSGGTIGTYADLASFFMTVVGSYFGLYVFGSLSDGVGIFRTIGLAMKLPVFKEKDIITKLMSMAEKARREGLLALEDEIGDLDDEFMSKGLRMVVDGTDAEVIRTLMETELNQLQGRHADKIGLVNMWGTLAPGMGMLGTVVGLIAMLKNLEDKSALGPNMAVALITTLYGAMIANIVMIPLGGKLKTYDAMESKVKEMVIEGVLSIQAGDNPRILAMKLLSYVEPKDRKALEEQLLGKD